MTSSWLFLSTPNYDARSTIHQIYLTVYLLTYLLTPGSRVPFEKLTGSQLVKKFPAFYGTPKVQLIYECPPCIHILSQINPFYAQHPTSWISLLILSSHLRLGLPNEYIGHPGPVKGNFFFPMARQPPGGPSLPVWGSSTALRHTTLSRTPLGEWSARRRDVYLATCNTPDRHSCHQAVIRTRNPNKRTVMDWRLRPRGRRVGQYSTLFCLIT